MDNMYNKPKKPTTGGPMPIYNKPKKPTVKPGGPSGPVKPSMPPMVQAMKEKMAMKAQKGK